MFGHHLVELIKTERLETTSLKDILLSKLKTWAGVSHLSKDLAALTSSLIVIGLSWLRWKNENGHCI